MGCGRKIGEFECCSVVHADCLEAIKNVPHGTIEAVITDPPYGVDFDTDYTRFKGGVAQNKVYPSVKGDNKPFDPSPWLGYKRVILWGANCFPQYLSMGSWLIWDKRHTTGKAFLADGESAWMNYGHGTYIKSIVWQGFLRTEETFHPTQKPIKLMEWCIEKAGMPNMILDPYTGSGTTLLAARNLGKHFLGFEIDQNMYEIARMRLVTAEAQGELFNVSDLSDSLIKYHAETMDDDQG